MNRKLLIKNGRVWDGNQFYYADIRTEGDRIVEIAEGIDSPADFTFDASGMIVSAGLVDSHVHLKGISGDIYGTPADSSCLPFGVTAAVDVSAIKPTRAAADTCAVKTAVLGYINIQEDHADFAKAEQAFQVYQEKVVGMKMCFSTPAAQSITPLQEACSYAQTKGLPLMVHCTDSPVSMLSIVECLSAGDILTHPFHGGVNTADENNFAALRLAKEKGVWLDSGFAGNVHTRFSVLKAAAEIGIFPDTISTDITRFSVFQRGGRYGMTAAMSIARTAGMTEADIFRAVTSSPAQMFGKSQEWGSLQVGGKADIAVLKVCDEGINFQTKGGNNLESETGYRCMLTVADGEVVFRY